MEKTTVKILLIQDDPAYAERLKGNLQAESAIQFVLQSAGSLHEGKKVLTQETPDIVLLDLALPDSQGLDTFIQLHDQTPFTPIIILTGLEDELLALQAIQRGAQDYMLRGNSDAKFISRRVRYAIERHRMRVQLMNLSLKDELTSLYNRRGFFLLAEQQLKYAAQNSQPLLVLLFDVDSLKQINDQHGHLQGDVALTNTAEILRQTFRKSDIIARIGGDEFAVMAIDAALSCFPILKHRFHFQLNQLNSQRQQPFYLSVSIGVSGFDPAKATPLDELLFAADAALYNEKHLKHAV